MRKAVLVVLVILLFNGCSMKKEMVETKNTVQKSTMVENSEQLGDSMSNDREKADVETYDAENGKKYIGNINTKKFHLPDCHTLPKPENRVFFEDREDVVKEGYKPCENCYP